MEFKARLKVTTFFILASIYLHSFKTPPLRYGNRDYIFAVIVVMTINLEE